MIGGRMPDAAHAVLTAAATSRFDPLPQVRRIVGEELAPIVTKVDLEGRYPSEILRRIGAAGGFRLSNSQHPDGRPDLAAAIMVEAAIGEECGTTAFLAWCQNACAWYLENTSNAALRARLLPKVARAEILGGTALSNPLKHYCQIEPLRLSAVRVDGGYVVSGLLPWVSNLGPDHWFGCVFRVGEDAASRDVMALVPCNAPGFTLAQSSHFTALEGSATFALRFRDVFVPDDQILADSAPAMVERIRTGFILLQIGIGAGLIRACIAIMRRVDKSLAHVNRYLDDRPDSLEARLAALEATTARLAATPHEADRDYFRQVLMARAEASELSLAAAQSAMLHAGARGYVIQAAAQRRVRESYFVAIVTPALKQLRHMLAMLDTTATSPH
jgi:alkylation response protein AidB-like acyl-CoA dehydrogenase